MCSSVLAPMLTPIAFTRGAPRRSSSASTSLAAWRNVNVLDGFVERPWPRRSGTITRKPAGSPPVNTCCQSAPIPVPPCSSSSGSPSPRSSQYIWNPLTSTVSARAIGISFAGCILSTDDEAGLNVRGRLGLSPLAGGPRETNAGGLATARQRVGAWNHEPAHRYLIRDGDQRVAGVSGPDSRPDPTRARRRDRVA